MSIIGDPTIYNSDPSRYKVKIHNITEQIYSQRSPMNETAFSLREQRENDKNETDDLLIMNTQNGTRMGSKMSQTHRNKKI